MSSTGFVTLVRMNTNNEVIAKNTVFNVYDKDNNHICDVKVNRTNVIYLDKHPSDLLVGDYIFIQEKA